MKNQVIHYNLNTLKHFELNAAMRSRCFGVQNWKFCMKTDIILNAMH